MRLPNWLRTRRALIERADRWENVARKLDADLSAALKNAYERDQHRTERVVFWQKATAKAENRAADLRAQLAEAQQTIRVGLDGAEQGHEEAERLRAEVGRMRDGIIEFAGLHADLANVERESTAKWSGSDVAGWHRRVAGRLNEILDPPTEPAPDPERLDAAMHSRDTYAQRQAVQQQPSPEDQAALGRWMETARQIASRTGLPAHYYQPDHEQALKTHLEARAVQRRVDARLSSEAPDGAA